MTDSIRSKVMNFAEALLDKDELRELSLEVIAGSCLSFAEAQELPIGGSQCI
jgi:hypothetical protein